MTLPKATRRRISEAAREQRTGMSDEEWEEHLLSLAKTQCEILNLLIENNGPQGMRFRLQVKHHDGDWATTV